MQIDSKHKMLLGHALDYAHQLERQVRPTWAISWSVLRFYLYRLWQYCIYKMFCLKIATSYQRFSRGFDKQRVIKIKQTPYCERCNGIQALQVHHKQGRVEGHGIENLETLCVDCHRQEHGRYIPCWAS